MKAGVKENVLKQLDGGMLAHSDLTYVEKILDKKNKEKKLDAGKNTESTTDSGMFSQFYQIFV